MESRFHKHMLMDVTRNRVFYTDFTTAADCECGWVLAGRQLERLREHYLPLDGGPGSHSPLSWIGGVEVYTVLSILSQNLTARNLHIGRQC